MMEFSEAYDLGVRSAEELLRLRGKSVCWQMFLDPNALVRMKTHGAFYDLFQEVHGGLETMSRVAHEEFLEWIAHDLI
jgi:hypothetical protein